MTIAVELGSGVREGRGVEMWCQSMLHQSEPDDYSWGDRYSTIKKETHHQGLGLGLANKTGMSQSLINC